MSPGALPFRMFLFFRTLTPSSGWWEAVLGFASGWLPAFSVSELEYRPGRYICFFCRPEENGSGWKIAAGEFPARGPFFSGFIHDFAAIDITRGSVWPAGYIWIVWYRPISGIGTGNGKRLDIGVGVEYGRGIMLFSPTILV